MEGFTFGLIPTQAKRFCGMIREKIRQLFINDGLFA